MAFIFFFSSVMRDWHGNGHSNVKVFRASTETCPNIQRHAVAAHITLITPQQSMRHEKQTI